ncbi:MAG: hypothetical protein PHH91_01510 [Desulfuromonadaceae bacterium]|nr:hypothetical protein [Desulfuromonadaceae bacterium]
MPIQNIISAKKNSICILALILILLLSHSFVECAPPENIVIRYEVLVESSQLRTVIIDDGNRSIESVIPAVTPEEDSMVPFDIEVSIASVRVNPPWKPTPEMLEDPDERLVMKPFKGGEPDNPIGRIALYPTFTDPKFKYIRIHEAPELPQRILSRDENGNLRGYRESHGCVGIFFSDAREVVSHLTGLEKDVIDKLIYSHKSKYLPLKYQATIIFLKE